jgi:hypothetical protein
VGEDALCLSDGVGDEVLKQQDEQLFGRKARTKTLKLRGIQAALQGVGVLREEGVDALCVAVLLHEELVLGVGPLDGIPQHGKQTDVGHHRVDALRGLRVEQVAGGDLSGDARAAAVEVGLVPGHPTRPVPIEEHDLLSVGRHGHLRMLGQQRVEHGGAGLHGTDAQEAGKGHDALMKP